MGTTTQEPFGQLVRRYRRAAELTQEELAERAGISVRAVQGIEAGSDHRPRPDTVQLLLEALAVPVDDQTSFVAAAGRIAPAVGSSGVDESRTPPDGRLRPTLDRISAVPAPGTGREREIASEGRSTTEPICGSCGRETGDDFGFCPHCGAPLGTTVPLQKQRRRVTVLFCDVTDSTALGEALDPEALQTLLARYFERMKSIVESHGGTVEKFIGDAVMAVFGVPQLREDDALQAVRAAGEMLAALPELELQARIGINSGEVVTGTEERLATGDAVNVAARLEQAAAPGEVLLGRETVRLLGSAVETEAVPPLALKGKREPVPAYRLMGLKDSGERLRLTPMIGREREVRRVQDAFAQALEDQSCQLFTILGTAGVGKSRLAREFLDGIDGAWIVRGRCLPYGQGITYWPVVEVIRQLDTLPADDYAAAAMKSLLGESATLASAEEIAWAFRTLLEEQAQQQPLIVVFDDLQWGEETFLDLVEHVADLARDASILLLCMARPELLERRPGWGGGKWNATSVLLEPLTTTETDRLLDALGGVKDDVRQGIREAAEGNPLFVEEMVFLMRESGGNEIVVPPTIQALLAARLDQIEPAERHILECGSIEGRLFHRSTLTALLNEATNPQGTLVALVRKELVRPVRAQVAGDDAYRFRHLLIRDAAYDGLPKAVRAELHERFAAWLEERRADRIELDEIVGYHLEQATRYKQELGQPGTALAERAGERLAAAGQRALARGDTACRGLLERALALLRPIRLDTYLELDLAVAHDTDPEKVALAEAAAERARKAQDHRGAAVADIVAGISLENMAAISVDELEARVQHALPLLEGTDDHFGLLVLWEGCVFVAADRGHYEECVRAAEQMRFHAEQLGRPYALGRLADALKYSPRPADEVQRFLEPFLATTPHPWWRNAYAQVLAMLGRFDEAWAIAEDAKRRTDELGLSGVEHGKFVEIAMLAGDYEAAVGYWRGFCRFYEERSNWRLVSFGLLALGRCLCLLGRDDEAEPLVQRGRELVAGVEGDPWTEVCWRQVQALILSHRGQHEEAERLAREAVAIAEQTDMLNVQGDALCDLAEVLENAGRREEAVDALQQALERYERKKNLAMAAQVRRKLGVEEAAVRSV